MAFVVYDTNGFLKEKTSTAAIVGADSLTLTQGTAAASYNLSTLGTVDWLFPNGTTGLPRSMAAGALHEKGTGGWLSQGFQWIYGGYTPTSFTQNITPTITTNTGDDAASAAVSGSTGGQGLFTSAGAAYGFRVTVPVCQQTRNLLVYAEYYTCNVTATATLYGQTTTTKSITTTNGVGAAGASATFTASFSGGLGGFLTLSVVWHATISGTNPNVKFGFAYMT